MGSSVVPLLSSYEKLIIVYEKQISIAELARYDEQMVQILALEDKKKIYQDAIEQISRDRSQYTMITAEYRKKLESYIQRLQSHNDRLQRIITSWYSEDSHAMKQVSVQRKTLQGYGGISSSDIVSYYFDKKQ